MNLLLDVLSSVTPSGTASNSPSLSPQDVGSTQHSSARKGLIAGLVVGSCIVLVLLLVMTWALKRRHRHHHHHPESIEDWIDPFADSVPQQDRLDIREIKRRGYPTPSTSIPAINVRTVTGSDAAAHAAVPPSAEHAPRDGGNAGAHPSDIPANSSLLSRVNQSQASHVNDDHLRAIITEEVDRAMTRSRDRSGGLSHSASTDSLPPPSYYSRQT
jgi:hypothetical protein